MIQPQTQLQNPQPKPELNQMFTEYLSAKPIFTNRASLTTSFAPETIPHREEQVKALGRILAPLLKGEKASNVFIYGKTGTGKTLISKYVAAELENVSKQTSQKLKVLYVNCKMKRAADTEYRLLASLMKELGKEVPFTGLPTDKIYQDFHTLLDSEKQTILLIVDEIDVLVKKTGDEILYNLTRMNQDLKNSRVCLVGITNDLGFINNLDPRVRSSLSEEELVFPPYNAMQLMDILRQRSALAFDSSSLEAGVIEKCAALAAQEHGDARRALDLLRVAGELAERSGLQKILVEHVDNAQEKVDCDRVVEVAKSQPRQSQAILFSILKLSDVGSEQKNVKNERLKEIQTGDVCDYYHKICGRYGLKPLTQRRISDLIAEFDLFGIISTKVISRGRYGRTRVISLALDESLIKKVYGVLGEVFY